MAAIHKLLLRRYEEKKIQTNHLTSASNFEDNIDKHTKDLKEFERKQAAGSCSIGNFEYQNNQVETKTTEDFTVKNLFDPLRQEYIKKKHFELQADVSTIEASMSPVAEDEVRMLKSASSPVPMTVVRTFSLSSSKFNSAKDCVLNGDVENQIAYMVLADVDVYGRIDFVDIEEKLLSQFPGMTEVSQNKVLDVPEDNLKPPVIDDDILVEEDFDQDEPISFRLRKKRSHKTGGLFPKSETIHDWIDEFEFLDSENEKPENYEMTKELIPSPLQATSLNNAVQPINQFNSEAEIPLPPKTTNLNSKQETKSNKPDEGFLRNVCKDNQYKDSCVKNGNFCFLSSCVKTREKLENTAGQDLDSQFSSIRFSGLKLCIKRQKLNSSSDNNDRNDVDEKNDKGDSMVSQSIRSMMLNEIPSSTTLSLERTQKTSINGNFLSGGVQYLLPTTKLQTSGESLQNIITRNELTQTVKSIKDSLTSSGANEFNSWSMDKIRESKIARSSGPSGETTTVEKIAIGSENVTKSTDARCVIAKEKGKLLKKNGGKKKDSKSFSSSSPSDESETENRLALEFPRHNWLVKHLMKEKKLKSDLIMPGNSKPLPIPSSYDNDESHSNKAESLIKDNDSLSSSPVLFVHSGLTNNDNNQRNMIGIVKPFCYNKEPSSERKASTDKFEGVEPSKSTKTSHKDMEALPDKSHNSGKNFDCPITKSFDVKIENCFSLAVAPAQQNNTPLDLTSKAALLEDYCALDLSKKAPEKESNKKNAKMSEASQLVDQMKNSNSATFPVQVGSTSTNIYSVSASVLAGTSVFSTASVALNSAPLVPLSNPPPISKETLSKAKTYQTNGTLTKLNEDQNLCLTNTVGLSLASPNVVSNLNEDKINKTTQNKSDHLLRPTVSKTNSCSNIRNSLKSLGDYKSASNCNHLSLDESGKGSEKFSDKNFFQRYASKSDPIIHRRKTEIHANVSHDSVIIDVDALDENRSKAYSSMYRNANPLLQRKHSKDTITLSSNSCDDGKKSYHNTALPSTSIITKPPHKKHHLMTPFSSSSSSSSLRIEKDPNKHLDSTHPTFRKETYFPKGVSRDINSSSLISKPIPHFRPRVALENHQNIAASKMCPTKDITLQYKNLQYSRRPLIGGTSESLATSKSSPFSPSEFVTHKSNFYPKLISNTKEASTSRSLNQAYISTSCLSATSAIQRRPKSTFVTVESNKFRPPIKPTPVQAKRLKVPFQTPSHVISSPQYHQRSRNLHSASSNISRDGARPHDSTVSRCSSAPFIPRPPVVRAPPGGVSINSLPLQPSHLQVNNNFLASYSINATKPKDVVLSSNYSLSSPSLKGISIEEADRITAQLKAEQLQLEHKIMSIEMLKKRIHSAPACSPTYLKKSESTSLFPKQIFIPSTSLDVRKHKSQEISGTFFPMPPGGRFYKQIDRYEPPAKMMRTASSSFSGVKKTVDGKSGAEEKCVVCMQKAFFVCSGCKSMWYCSEECQFKDWTKHCKACA